MSSFHSHSNYSMLYINLPIQLSVFSKVFQVIQMDISLSKRTSKYERVRAEVDVTDDEDDIGTFVGESVEKSGVFGLISQVWSFLLFSWIRPLLELGNKQPLEQNDLLDLHQTDKAVSVYSRFRKAWKLQMDEKKPSLFWAYAEAFGRPFVAAGFLKLIHDSCLFVGPYLLNKIIEFLNNPSEPQSTGLWYVLGLFLSNAIMSLCLRQYFW